MNSSHKQQVLKKPKLFRFLYPSSSATGKEQRQFPHCSLGGISVGYLVNFYCETPFLNILLIKQ